LPISANPYRELGAIRDSGGSGGTFLRMADDEQQHQDEIARILAEDPNANIVDGEPQAWLLTGKALDVAKAAIGRDPD
jgi:hypothetical protein